MGGLWGWFEDYMQSPIGRVLVQSAPRLGSHYESFWLFPMQVGREGLSKRRQGGPACCSPDPARSPGMARARRSVCRSLNGSMGAGGRCTVCL